MVSIGSARAGIVRLSLYALATLICIPVQSTLKAVVPWFSGRSASFYHRVCCRILGLDIEVVGEISRDRPTLFIANHCSYLDIPVLGSLNVFSFIAKSEVETWPLFGLLAKLQKTVFIRRGDRSDAGRQRDGMVERLAAGDSLLLFAEGTSSDGNRVLPFKTALFAAAGTEVDGQPVLVQPVSLVCTHLDDLPLGHDLRSLYAWYGDMDLLPHLWAVACAGRLRVRVEYHPVVTVADVGSRKALADYCYRAVAAGVERGVAGRRTPPVDRPDGLPVGTPVSGAAT